LRVALTFDVERDCPPISETTVGLERGLPKVLEILDKYDITATFFTTGDVARLFPGVIKKIAEKHEIASHGYHHKRFDYVTAREEAEIRQSKQLLESITKKKVLGFRAPRFLVCKELYQVLPKLGFKYDSSITYFKPSHFVINTKLTEYRVQLPGGLFRFPGGLRLFEIACKASSFPVLCFHCWEAIDMRLLLHFTNTNATFRNWCMRPDRWYNTGYPFLERLKSLIVSLLAKDFLFVTLKDTTDESIN